MTLMGTGSAVAFTVGIVQPARSSSRAKELHRPRPAERALRIHVDGFELPLADEAESNLRFGRICYVHTLWGELDPMFLYLGEEMLSCSQGLAVVVTQELIAILVPWLARRYRGAREIICTHAVRHWKTESLIRRIGELHLREDLFVHCECFLAGNNPQLELGNFLGRRVF